MKKYPINLSEFRKLISNQGFQILLLEAGLCLKSFGDNDEYVHIYKYPSDPASEIASFKKSDALITLCNAFSDNSHVRELEVKKSIRINFYKGKNDGENPIKVDSIDLEV